MVGDVTAYRLYVLSSDGHITGPPDTIECEDDRGAIETAKQLLDGKAIEVWDGNRLVIRVEPNNG